MSGSQQLLLGGKKAAEAVYIEDIFSTYLYTGNGSTQTITNGIDLLGKGGLVWQKARSSNANHLLTDTVRGSGYSLNSNSTLGQFYNASIVSSFNSNGFTDGASQVNGVTYASWTFRKQPKFFDVVTWTGSGANRTIAHNLGSVPGCIIVKRTDAAANWQVYHRSLANTQYLILNNTAGAATGATRWNSTTPTDTVFSLGTDATVNASGGTYVAYIYAHNAGGFGESGTDNVISCGSLTTNAAGNASVTLGYEPQWFLWKRTDVADGWAIVDTMRGWNLSASDAMLFPNLTNSETSGSRENPTATGFDFTGMASASYIYIAIRRGPMKVPTDGTSVFTPVATSAATGTKLTTNFPVDLQIFSLRTGTTNKNQTVDRLRGVSTNASEGGAQLITSSTAAETTNSVPTLFWDNTGFQMPSSYGGTSEIFWNFRRAPGFFDQIVYTGTAANTTVPHGLTVVPEMMIFKARQSATSWPVYHKDVGPTKAMYLNQNVVPATNSVFFNNTAPTASVVSLGSSSTTNSNFATNEMLCYLFASCPGVSKVGSYTGTGATQVIDCGFTGGARFVLIKATSTTGNWYVWDTARGIVAGNDPYLLLNSTGPEVTTTDWVDAAASGFELSNAAGNLANSSGVSYIFLAIA